MKRSSSSSANAAAAAAALRRAYSSASSPSSAPANANANAKLPSVEFPSSPQTETAASADQLIHYTHSKHPIAQITLPDLFVCSGCKEYGAGKRFACQECDFQLHEFCALSPPLLKSHPLHGQHHLVFHSRPKQGMYVLILSP